MTGQERNDSDDDVGLAVAVGLANALTGPHAVKDPDQELRGILAVDPPSISQLRSKDLAAFVRLAAGVRAVLLDLASGRVDDAAIAVNALLAAHSAHPHLVKDRGVWRLHHHPEDVELVPMWTAICADALARLIGMGRADRAGVCDAVSCERTFVDQSKNASRRYCSTRCQDRTKAAAYRRRQSR